MRKNFGAKAILYPMPVLIIGTYDELHNIANNDQALNGVIINPNSATLPIWKKDMDLIEITSQGDSKFYVSDNDNSEEKKPKTGLFSKIKNLFK